MINKLLRLHFFFFLLDTFINLRSVSVVCLFNPFHLAARYSDIFRFEKLLLFYKAIYLGRRWPEGEVRK